MLGADMSTAADAQPGTWITVGVLVGLALALLVGVLLSGVFRARRAARAARARRAAAPAPLPAVGPPPSGPAAVVGFPVDDLPGFLDRPPGSDDGTGALPAGAPAGQVSAPVERTGSTAATPSPEPPAVPDGARPADDGAAPGRGGTLGLTASAVLLVAAVVVAYAGGSSGTTPAADASVTGLSVPPAATAAAPMPTLDDGAAGALAMTSVPLGGSGVAATGTFQGLVLEQRAVGLTVTYPGVSVSTDGRHALAHVRLPTFNCLTPEPPADPTVANCVSTPTEYADLADPDLQVTRDGDRVELVGLFATYTRPNGSAPVYTGRAYRLSAAFTPTGPSVEGAAPAAGVVRIGVGSAPSVAAPGVTLLQHP